MTAVTNLTSNLLPDFLTNNPLPQGFPWGSATANNTNYYDTWPDTGVTRTYTWSIAKGTCAPDGVELDCVLVNNQFPGPLVEANWGDMIEIQVTNNLDEGTAIHFHGFLQKNSQWMDGVPGVQQCPIAPGKTFTYRTRAELYGTAWYHSHYDAQSANGLYGPVVVYGPKNAEYDADLGPVVLGDWVHTDFHDLVDELMAPYPNAKIPPSQNILINGLNPYYGANAPTAKFQVSSGKKYRLRLISAACSATVKYTIDNHSFTVIANDFVPVNPYQTDHITLSVGQRSDVIVNFNQDPTTAVWMRTFIAPCSEAEGQTEAKAAVYYQNADTSSLPVSSPGANAYNTYCGNDDLSQTTPYYPITPPSPSFESVIPISAQVNGSHLLWYMAGRTFRTNYNDPMLLEAKLGNLDFPYIGNVHNYGDNSSVLFVIENTGSMPHPMHLHGHNMFVLAEGECTDNNFVFGRSDGVAAADLNNTNKAYGNCWDGHVTNADNPQRRDVQMLLPGQYIVIQWLQDNPGVWPLHCHLTWHSASGFVWSVLERPDDIANMPIPSVMADTCRDWAAWTGENVVDMIDDGL
ncbi:multicopper oxidase [Zasmidium cellare ATCC 36951]|uniref:Multicopper oxidase n=1 Tax=Zasmidium cellare ATCC 36951 TaxID=1080233 RepID=A0A6A6CN92_ZASCE|nr:multicopper oxidase [Zasmidium cellare ATCC 36951]KAF2168605.1 multicopper oxidase [Zasmidium cellare ATCC 36951]